MLYCVSTVTSKDGPVGKVVLVEAETFAGAFEQAASLGSVDGGSQEVAALLIPSDEAETLLRHPDKWRGKVLNAFEALTLIRSIRAEEGVPVDDDTNETN